MTDRVVLARFISKEDCKDIDARNIANNKVSINGASKGQDYFCINCYYPLTVCAGKNNIKYFRHNKSIYEDIIGERFVSRLESNTEKVLKNISSIRNIKSQAKIPGENRKSYDFEFTYEGKNYLLEVDGSQHFKENKKFHKHRDDFREQQQRDIKYTQLALDNNYIIIRIDYKHEKDIEKIIRLALKSKETFYFSDDKLYSHIIHKIKF
jgi:hypothetical protein